ncbi:DNA polymerase domain-containing protein [Dyella soli]|uniref:DNA polymerase domain-containing protein n=1 Tax=Dyella soli TaxID=522319 RepID=A0A4R0Z0D3_9GAMM|nr:DNA polymerase domain-containing protein [Dyella soli]
MAITHAERMVYPDDGITRQEVADYYAAIMDRFLPQVEGRPTSVLRFPEGIGQPGFFQKHPMQGLRHVHSIRLVEADGGHGDYLCPRDARAVIELVQFGALEFHPWAARADALDEADYLVFDLDPAVDVAWTTVVAAARMIDKKLAAIGLRSFVRTSGGKGLHVVVPLHSSCGWNDAGQFAHAFARQLAGEQPDAFTSTASKHGRAGRIFIDYLRNSRGATSVASYSLRGRAGAPVAMPLRWSELGRSSGGDHYTLRPARRRLARQASDPWEGFVDMRQDLREAAQRLGK